jgi:hypothetical protein
VNIHRYHAAVSRSNEQVGFLHNNLARILNAGALFTFLRFNLLLSFLRFNLLLFVKYLLLCLVTSEKCLHICKEKFDSFVLSLFKLSDKCRQ